MDKSYVVHIQRLSKIIGFIKCEIKIGEYLSNASEEYRKKLETVMEGNTLSKPIKDTIGYLEQTLETYKKDTKAQRTDEQEDYIASINDTIEDVTHKLDEFLYMEDIIRKLLMKTFRPDTLGWDSRIRLIEGYMDYLMRSEKSFENTLTVSRQMYTRMHNIHYGLKPV